jgi:hypothetical protein
VTAPQSTDPGRAAAYPDRGGDPYPDRDPSPERADSSPDRGGSRIDAALAALAEVKDAPPAQQVVPLTQAHQALRETLDSIGDV